MSGMAKRCQEIDLTMARYFIDVVVRRRNMSKRSGESYLAGLPRFLFFVAAGLHGVFRFFKRTLRDEKIEVGLVSQISRLAEVRSQCKALERAKLNVIPMQRLNEAYEF